MGEIGFQSDNHAIMLTALDNINNFILTFSAVLCIDKLSDFILSFNSKRTLTHFMMTL